MFTVALVTWLPWLLGCYGSGRHGDRTVLCSHVHNVIYMYISLFSCLVKKGFKFNVLLIYTYLP